MDIAGQSEIYLEKLSTKKKRPIRRSTQIAYRSYIDTWIIPQIGQLPLKDVKNGVLKKLVAHVAKSDRSASTIAGVLNCVKGIIKSATDENGDLLYPNIWNNDFIDAPVIDPREQDTPVISSLEASQAILKATGQFRPFLALLAGSGLRIGEALALRGCPTPGRSYWDFSRAVLVINKAMSRGVEGPTKTAAGVREIDLDPALNAYLIKTTDCRTSYWFQNNRSNAMRANTVRDRAIAVGLIGGFHSLRRFRLTHLDSQNVPRGLVDFWAGHEGTDVHDRYMKIGQDIETRKMWAAKAGLGFELPEIK